MPERTGNRSTSSKPPDQQHRGIITVLGKKDVDECGGRADGGESRHFPPDQAR